MQQPQRLHGSYRPWSRKGAAKGFASKGSGWAPSSFSRLGRRVSILCGAVLPTGNGTDLGEHKMSKAAKISEPASELEHLIADLSASGPLVFVFGDGFTTAHLVGTTAPVFRGPADRRWWHVEIGDDAANWIMDVRVDQITGVRFVREPYL
jgi:hypothetical protein